jgi:hypothetical protein
MAQSNWLAGRVWWPGYGGLLGGEGRESPAAVPRVIVGILGLIMFTFIGPLLVSIVFGLVVFIPGGVAGAWLWKKGAGGAL